MTIENLSLSKNDREIFSNVGFSLFLGAAVIITGKNGSGKTSLLRILAGISKESSGKILWNGQDIAKIRQELNSEMQFIGHKNFLKPDLTVLENLEFYASFYDSKILIPSALNFFKITSLADQKVRGLSAGEMKKVMLCKLMICPATLWILDEPDVNLDKNSKKLLSGLIRAKIENGGMVIVASHEAGIYEESSPAILSMDDFN